jgi:hypothetical protein
MIIMRAIPANMIGELLSINTAVRLRPHPFPAGAVRNVPDVAD